MNKYNSAKVLLEAGANPNTVDYQFGESPLFQATGYFWNDKEYDENPKMLKLLLNHGANPNVVYKGNSKDDFIQSAIEAGISPLIYSIGTFGDKEKTALLVEASADINHKTDNDMTATVYALLLNKPEKAHFLS